MAQKQKSKVLESGIRVNHPEWGKGTIICCYATFENDLKNEYYVQYDGQGGQIGSARTEFALLDEPKREIPHMEEEAYDDEEEFDEEEDENYDDDDEDDGDEFDDEDDEEIEDYQEDEYEDWEEDDEDDEVEEDEDDEDEA